MNCSFDKEIIQKYVDNTIEPLELIILKEHIVVCPECKFELDLMNKLENSMVEYFKSLPDNELLDEFSMNVLKQCCDEGEAYSFAQALAKAWEINKMVAGNAARYTAYLPGSKLAVQTAKKANSRIHQAVKSYAKNSFKKLIAGAVR